MHAVDPLSNAPVTTGLGYFRLHGRTGYHYRFTRPDLEQMWAITRAHDPCYVFFNNLSMLEDAGQLLKVAAEWRTKPG